MSARIVTANLLALGDVVFLTGDHKWSKRIDDAALAHSDDEAAALEAQAMGDIDKNLIVDPYLVDVEPLNGAIKPVHIRERIRTLGPTVHLDHGKQATGDGGQFAPDDDAGPVTSSNAAKLARGKRS